MASLEGTTLSGRYFLRRLVGEGGAAQVYQAWDQTRLTMLAIKVIRPPFSPTAISNEATVLESVVHPNIVRMYGFVSQNSPALNYIVMEWVDGSDLKTALRERKRPFSPSEVFVILRQLTSALTYIHRMEIIHGDIKPANILKSNTDQAVKLTDLGLARHTAKRTVAGTPLYMAPELFRGLPNSIGSDIYALGITVYELLSGGITPFSGEGHHLTGSLVENLAWEHSNAPVPNLRIYNTAVTRDLAAVVDKALSKDPKQRYGSVQEFTAAFENALNQPPRSIPQEAFCPEHGPYDASLGACPYPHASASPRPRPANLLDEEDTDFATRPTDRPAPVDQDSDEGKTRIPVARGIRHDDYDDEDTTPPMSGDIEDTLQDIPITPRSTQRRSEGGDAGGRIRSDRSRLPERVLNANFAHLRGMQKLRQNEGLVQGEKCCLLVDIGPHWKNGQSIARGAIDLTQVLTGRDDYVIQAVFVSEDFEPEMTSAEIWVPADGGRTFPYIDGKRAKEPGPVALWVRAPSFPVGSRQRSAIAHGRLCLYYQSYLIQSAVVTVGIVRERSTRLTMQNQMKVDFVLTRDFSEVRRRFQNRGIMFEYSEPSGRPVSLNLTMNDDGHGQHRILAKHHIGDPTEIGLPPAWKKYDPMAGADILAQFRNELLTCYEEYDPAKFRNRREKFIADLTSMAIIGSKLYAAALSDLSVADGVDAWDWEEKFQQSLAEAAVIQISRTGPATYVFPWAMVYEYPLEEGMRRSYESCRSLWEEWDENALREQPAGLGCIHQEEHLQKLREAKAAGRIVSIICPYAFWGYKHVIEQPLSAVDQLSSAPNCIAAGGRLDLGIGITKDLDERDVHLRALRTAIPHLHLNPTKPAEDREEVRKMLRAPELVYFLCHGERDKGQTYISIGEHDKDPRHMITANTLLQWKRSSVDKSAWQRTHPLIFINGCGTADLRPGLAFDLVSAFANLEVSAVIGTEVSLQVKTAFPAAMAILRGMASGGELCPTIREMRWDLLNKGDLLGLAYTPYGLADVHIE